MRLRKLHSINYYLSIGRHSFVCWPTLIQAVHVHLPEILVKQIEHLFAHYKDLETGKWAKTEAWGGHGEAEQLISEAIERAKD